MKLYVSNLSFDKVGETELRDLFEEFGVIKDVRLIRDRSTDTSRGFGFITFKDRADGERAMQALRKTEFFGRVLWIDEAKERGYES